MYNILKNVKFWLIIAISTVSIIFFYNSFSTPPPVNYDLISKEITCYNMSDKYLQLKADDNLNTSQQTIFFLETSCKGGLNSRQACAVESAARAHPRWRVYVLLAGPLDVHYQNGKTFSLISSLANVKFVRLNVSEFSKGTQVESLYSENVFTKSSYPVVHNADVLRLLILNKYGGVYLDLDVVVIKSFNTLPKTFVAEEAEGVVTNAILGLPKDGIGKQLSETALRVLGKSYDLHSWGGNGPAVIERALRQICNTNDSARWSADNCQGVEVFSKKYFYPIHYGDWKSYYEDSMADDALAGVGGPGAGADSAYTHHVWNHFGEKAAIKPNSLYAKLANKYCPDVYHMYGNRFGV